MYLMYCMPKLVYKRDGHEIELFDKYKTLHLSWYGNVNSDTYMHFFEAMLKLSIANNIENWLIDAREVDFMELGEREWTINYFRKDVLKSPVKKIARLASGNFENEAYISSVISSVIDKQNMAFKFRYHPDANSAFEWFKENN